MSGGREIPRPKGGGWFRARYEGACRGCQAPIYEGEWVAYNEDGVVCCRPCVEKEREDGE